MHNRRLHIMQILTVLTVAMLGGCGGGSVSEATPPDETPTPLITTINDEADDISDIPTETEEDEDDGDVDDDAVTVSDDGDDDTEDDDDADVPDPSPPPPPPAYSYTGDFSAVWASEGGFKIPQEYLIGTADPATTINSVWDGETVALFGARNEVINVMLTLEAANQAVPDVRVTVGQLTGSNGVTLQTAPAEGAALFDWTDRQIELFFVRYLEIKGLSRFCCEQYDERHLPQRFQRPYDEYGIGSGVWTDRPDHDLHYPDIAVPLELHPTFDVAAGTNQSIWVDLFIPTTAPTGTYTGALNIEENGVQTGTIPITLSVRNFTLPDTPTAKTMLFLGYGDINTRYLGESFPEADRDATVEALRDRHFLLAHRHKIALIDANQGATSWSSDSPRPAWIPRLDGSLFTAAHGYDGPGLNTGNGVFSIGTYGTWSWKDDGEIGMRQHTDAWVTWFASNAPTSEYFLYLIDESNDLSQIEQWATWIDNNPGPGNAMPSFATGFAPDFAASTPHLDIATSVMYVGHTPDWDAAHAYFHATPGKRFYMYNSGRPATGSFMTDDDGVALREQSWGAFKKQVDRWFYWESTYYNNYQGGSGQTNVFQQAKTFGSTDSVNDVAGEMGWNYSNGDGVLFYPGTDTVFPDESYDIPGPIASLRLKYWRRGIQDADYLAMASALNPTCVAALLNTVVPKALWEYGVDNVNDPTYVRTDISWSMSPDVWETARATLADIIETGTADFCVE